MKDNYLHKYVDFVMNFFWNLQPGEIVMLQTLQNKFYENKELKDKYFSFILNLLIGNEYLKSEGNVKIVLTEKGYAHLHENTPLLLSINIDEFVRKNSNRKAFFYNIWDIIGSEDKDSNPYFVTGPEFYNIIKSFLNGLPSSYSAYMNDIKEKHGKNVTKSVWCYELFSSLTEIQIQPFLNALSEMINKRISQAEEDNSSPDDSQIELDNDIIFQIEDNNRMAENCKTPKVFVSHKTEDSEYAKALVDLMLNLGVNEKQIFCSSYAGFGVPLGQDIFDYIQKQYEEHDLLVIFIHSPRYYQSPISLNEMGAAWILKKQYISFLTSDCDWRILQGVVSSRETAFKANQSNTYHYLNDFKQLLEHFFQLPSKDTTRWDSIRKDFLKSIESIRYER